MHSQGLIFFLWGRGGWIQVRFLVGVVSNLVLKIGAHQDEEDTMYEKDAEDRTHAYPSLASVKQHQSQLEETDRVPCPWD